MFHGTTGDQRESTPIRRGGCRRGAFCLTCVLRRGLLVGLRAGRTRADRLGLGSTTDWALADLRYSTLAVSPLT
jgi:hypothetical protein